MRSIRKHKKRKKNVQEQKRKGERDSSKNDYCQTEFPPRCTGVYFGTPQYFSRKNLDFYRDSGCTKVHPEKMGF